MSCSLENVPEQHQRRFDDRLGVVIYRLDKIDDANKEILAALKEQNQSLTVEIRRLESICDGRHEEAIASKEKLEALSAKVEKHSGYFNWVVLTVMGAVLLALLTLLIEGEVHARTTSNATSYTTKCILSPSGEACNTVLLAKGVRESDHLYSI